VRSVSVTVPIWFSLMRIAFAARRLIPWASRSGFVTKISSPTIWIVEPSRSVRSDHPSQSSSASPSSMDTTGYALAHCV